MKKAIISTFNFDLQHNWYDLSFSNNTEIVISEVIILVKYTSLKKKKLSQVIQGVYTPKHLLTLVRKTDTAGMVAYMLGFHYALPNSPE